MPDGRQNPHRQEHQAGISDAAPRQPPRPRHRRDRHRQDGDAAGAGRGLLATPAFRSSPPTSRATSRASPQPGDGKDALRQARARRSASTTCRIAFPWCSGTCSASRAIRSAPPSPRWGRCCSSRLLELNDTQEGVLNIAFRFADDAGPAAARPQGPARAAAASSPSNAERAHDAKYGNVVEATVGAIQRQLLVLENQGADKFFGEPALDINDFMQHGPRRPRHHQHPRRRQADERTRGSTRRSCCGCCPSCSRSCPKSAISISRSSCSSSTRRICCSTTRPRRCSTRSSRSCA